MHALPMRLRERVISGNNLFTATRSDLDAELLAVGQAQAKGILAQRDGINVDEAFELLRTYAHSRHQKLTDMADALMRHDPAADDPVPFAGGNPTP